MKNICFILISLCISLSSFAQTDAQHLKFKGVPIDGTLAAYVSKMKAAGFSDLGIKDGTAVLQGDFAGFKGCIIGVSTLKKTNVVNTIGVIFPECDNWSKLENNYQTLKEMLIQKYGEPADCVEKFQSYSQPNDDGLRLTFLRMDKCTYYTTFETPNGDIQLSLEHQDRRCFAKLQYWDKINTNKVKTQPMDDL